MKLKIPKWGACPPCSASEDLFAYCDECRDELVIVGSSEIDIEWWKWVLIGLLSPSTLGLPYVNDLWGDELLGERV